MIHLCILSIANKAGIVLSKFIRLYFVTGKNSPPLLYLSPVSSVKKGSERKFS
jgi:hypothetical protein